MRPMRMHQGQLSVTAEMVRELLVTQFPEYSHRAVEPVRVEGTVNAIFRIGDELVARFPLQPREVRATRVLLETEADAARELASGTRVPVPEPVAIGEPGAGSQAKMSPGRTSSM